MKSKWYKIILDITSITVGVWMVGVARLLSESGYYGDGFSFRVLAIAVAGLLAIRLTFLLNSSNPYV